MKCIMNPRPDIQEELIKPYKEMEDVYSLRCRGCNGERAGNAT